MVIFVFPADQTNFIILKIYNQNTLFIRRWKETHLHIKWLALHGRKYMNMKKPVLEDRPEITFTRRTQAHMVKISWKEFALSCFTWCSEVSLYFV